MEHMPSNSTNKVLKESSIVVYYETMFKYIIIQLEYHLRRLAINLIMKTKLTYFLNPWVNHDYKIWV